MAISQAAEITVGLILTVFAGILNGSWNAAFNPSLNLAVGRTPGTSTTDEQKENEVKKEYDLQYHHAFALFQIYAALLNLPVCFVWAGGAPNLQAVVRAAETSDLLLVSLFSFLWGLGSLGFGLACKIAGVGMGTNLTIGLVVVTGTFLPLCYEGVIRQPTGWIILPGLAVCLTGLYFSMESLKSRDLDDRAAAATNTSTPSTLSSKEGEETAEVIINQNESGRQNNNTTSPPEPASSPDNLELNPQQVQQDQNQSKDATTEPSHSTLQKVAICVISGLLATQLQFAFVFGQDIVDIANESGDTPAGGAAAIIWLFAISIGCPPIVAYMLYHSPQPTNVLWRSLLRIPGRHIKLFLTSSVPWVAHIHLYGLVSNVLLPSDVGSSIAWPLLMMSTVAQGMILSLLLGEWHNSSARTGRKLRLGLGLAVTGIAILMASAAV